MTNTADRYGAQFGPDITFLGVGRANLADPATYATADVVVLGAPFDGGTSHRPGTRFGPSAIRQACYLPLDGSRPHLALRVDALRDIVVVDAGDVEMYSGDIETALPPLENAVYAVAKAGAVPLVLGGDHSITLPDATGVARHLGYGKVSMIHFDAHADTGDIAFGSLYGHSRCADSSNRERCVVIASYRWVCVAIGPNPKPWGGWPIRTCAPSR
jgi:arginase family enzyme